MKNIVPLIIFCVLNTTNPYQTSQFIITRFTSKTEIDNFFCGSKFYDEYFKSVDAENIIIESPLYESSYDISKIPKNFSYYSKPNIPYMPKFLPKIKIEHNWSKNDDEYFGNIKTKYIDFELIIKPTKDYDSCNYILNIQAAILEKRKKIIPDKCLDYILKDFCKVFIQISNTLAET